MYAVTSMAVFCSPLMSCFPVMLLRYFLNDIQTFPAAHVLLVSHLLLHTTRAAFVLYCLYVWESSRFLAWWHFYFLKLRCILTDMFILYYRELWCRPAYYWGWCCHCSLVDSIILHSWLLSTNFHCCTVHLTQIHFLFHQPMHLWIDQY